jgi:hypothetical protein
MNMLNILLLILVLGEIVVCVFIMRQHYQKRQRQDPQTVGQFDWQDRELWVTRCFLVSGMIFFLGLVMHFFL